MRDQNSKNLIDLSLPEETQRYYFKVLATKIILSQPDAYGFNFNKEDYFEHLPTIPFEFKVTKSRMSLKEMSNLFELPIIALKEYNPHIRNSYLPAGSYTLNLPEENYSNYRGKTQSKNKVQVVDNETYSGVESEMAQETMPTLK
jgi:hypothetical protein